MAGHGEYSVSYTELRQIIAMAEWGQDIITELDELTPHVKHIKECRIIAEIHPPMGSYPETNIGLSYFEVWTSNIKYYSEETYGDQIIKEEPIIPGSHPGQTYDDLMDLYKKHQATETTVGQNVIDALKNISKDTEIAEQIIGKIVDKIIAADVQKHIPSEMDNIEHAQATLCDVYQRIMGIANNEERRKNESE